MKHLAKMTLITAAFVQSAKKVLEIWSFIADAIAKLGFDNQPPLLVIFKIKSVNGLQSFHLILDKSDGVMVACSYLGVDILLTKVNDGQKAMAASCNAAGTSVIVAKLMLESMAKNPCPAWGYMLTI